MSDKWCPVCHEPAHISGCALDRIADLETERDEALDRFEAAQKTANGERTSFRYQLAEARKWSNHWETRCKEDEVDRVEAQAKIADIMEQNDNLRDRLEAAKHQGMKEFEAHQRSIGELNSLRSQLGLALRAVPVEVWAQIQQAIHSLL